MSKHRASNRSSVHRLVPLGAGLTVAALAAGTGSAFAVEAIVPAQALTCEQANAALTTAQGKIGSLAKARDEARIKLNAARAAVRAYDDAVRSRNAAEDRLESAEKWQAEKQAAFDAQVLRSETDKSRAAKRDLDRAARALRNAKDETSSAQKKFDRKQAALDALTPVAQVQRDTVNTARDALHGAEAALAAAKGDRSSARTDRDKACAAPAKRSTTAITSGVL